MWRTISIITAMLVGSGCAYQVPAVNVATPNVYSTYENKIPGKYVLVLDDSVTSVSRDVKASSYVCSAHSYPINLGGTMGSSVRKLMESLFDSLDAAQSMPSKETMKRDRINGAIVVKLDSFEPRFSCHMGFWSGTCTASVDMGFGVTVTGPSDRLLAFSVSGSKTTDGDAGAGCDGAATVLGEAISRSEKDALERMGERISNSQNLRKP